MIEEKETAVAEAVSSAAKKFKEDIRGFAAKHEDAMTMLRNARENLQEHRLACEMDRMADREIATQRQTEFDRGASEPHRTTHTQSCGRS
jgi:hypothetical protein